MVVSHGLQIRGSGELSIRNYETYHPSVHALRLQRDAAARQGADQAHIEGADGGGDAADEARQIKEHA